VSAASEYRLDDSGHGPALLSNSIPARMPQGKKDVP
jgi:hypothetical protein